MTIDEARKVLGEFFDEKPNEDWFSYRSSGAVDLSGFGTKRVAKLTLGTETLAFTIGETERGQRLKLRASIEAIIARESLKLIDEPSTSGSRLAVYRAIRLRSCDPEQLRRVLLRLEGVLIGATNAGADHHPDVCDAAALDPPGRGE